MRRQPATYRGGAVAAVLVATVMVAGAAGDGWGARTPQVPPFDYNLDIDLKPEPTPMGTGYQLSFRGYSVEKVPGEQGGMRVWLEERSSDLVLDVVAYKAGRRLEGRGWPGGETPAKWFEFKVPELVLLPDETFTVQLRFKGCTEVVRLAFRPGQGLVVDPSGTRFMQGERKIRVFPDYAQVATRFGQTAYVAGNLSLAAIRGHTRLWSAPLPLDSTPERMEVVGEALLIRTRRGHSYYASCRDGELVYHHAGHVVGKSPTDELLAIARQEAEKRGGQMDRKPFVLAMGALRDRRGVPYLIETIDAGRGTTVKALAVAALERLNGNEALWKEATGPAAGRAVAGLYGRVSTAEGRRREAARWRRVFDLEAIEPAAAMGDAGKAGEDAWVTLFGDDERYRARTSEEADYSAALELAEDSGDEGVTFHYRLGERVVYTLGRRLPALDAVVGKRVTLRGRTANVTWHGKDVEAVWPGAVRTDHREP